MCLNKTNKPKGSRRSKLWEKHIQLWKKVEKKEENEKKMYNTLSIMNKI
jgi:hypothetical protein